jgi:flagellar biosynthetic protein FliR
MNTETAAVLIEFFNRLDVFSLILVRVLAFFLFMPVVSGMNIPMAVRMTLALCFAAVLFFSNAVTTVSYYNTTIGYVMLIVTEFLTGMFMGYMVFFVFNIIYYTGQLIDYQIGLSMMSVLDPMTQIQVPIVGNLYYLAVSAMLVVTGGLNSFISAFFYSYQLVPVGTANIIGNASVAWYAVTLLTEFILLGVKIALPVVGAILVIDVALGLMVKAVPQMNIFVVGMPMKLLAGLFLLLFVMAPTLSTIYHYIFELAYEALGNIIAGMSP